MEQGVVPLSEGSERADHALAEGLAEGRGSEWAWVLEQRVGAEEFLAVEEVRDWRGMESPVGEEVSD
jgi:hypothetical protein